MLAQVTGDLAGRGLLALAVTALVTWLFYAVTLHLAATFFIGDVASQLAATASTAPTLVSILLERVGLSGDVVTTPGLDVVIAVLVAVAADALAIRSVYRLAPVPTATLTALHVAFATVLGVALSNIFGLL